jgi:hypothetical protein
MAVSINAKSEARICNSLIVGFAELPVIEGIEGAICWALPGYGIVCDEEKARKVATKLDSMIRDNVSKSGRSLH